MVFKKGNVPWNKGLSKNNSKIAEICQRVSQTKKAQHSRGELIVWNKGKNKFVDKRLAQQGKAASETKKRRYATGELVVWNKGKKNTQIPWNKGREGLQKAWNKGLNKENNLFIRRQAESLKGSWDVKYGVLHAEKRKAKIRTARLKQSFNKISSIELKTKKILLCLGCEEKQSLDNCKSWLDFACQQPLEGICVPDFVFPLQSLIINCDGDYWHGNLKLFNELNAIQKKTRKRDIMQNKLLKEKGWLVLRFWEHFIKEKEERYENILANILNIQLTL